MTGDSSCRPGPLFVIGLWRSGTSLLYSLLNQHPQIALLYEGDLFLLRALFSRKGGKADWLARWEFWNSALSRHQIQTDRIPSAVPDLPTAAMAVWKEYAGDATVIGEKSPNYCDHLQDVARQFPNARFVVIWRDLADICRSMIRARAGSSFFSKPGLCHRAVIGFGKLKLECDALLDQGVPVHQIQYEEMIQDPTRVMMGICEFLELPFDPRMASLRDSDRSAIYLGSHHELTKGEQIITYRERDEVLPAHLQRKIQRYVNYWQAQSGGTWPRYPKTPASTPVFPNAAQRLADKMLYRGLRAVDSFTEFVYCYAPYLLLQKHRSIKNRRFEGSPVTKVDSPQQGVEILNSLER